MAQIIETIDVDVPVDMAYNQWTQFADFPEFIEEVVATHQVTDTLTRWKVNVAGVERQFDAEVTEQHPDERVAWTSTGGEVDHAGVVTVHKLSDTTSRVSAQIDWEPEGFVENMGALVGAGSRAVKKALRDFKEFIESRGTETGAWRGDVDA